MNITEFLLARIWEDEALARQEDEDYADTTLLPTYDSDHQANWNTGRVLAECAAKRAIIKRYQDAEESYVPLSYVIEALAAVYKDHPDYQEEWAL